MSSPIVVTLTLCTLWWSQEIDEEPLPAPRPIQLAQGGAGGPPTAAPGSTPAPAQPQPSAAEQISKLQRTVEADQKHLEELKKQLEDPESDYKKTETEFKELDTKRSDFKKEAHKLREEGKKAEADKLEADGGDLEKTWSMARDRFNLAIQERQTVQEKVGVLEEKIKQDKQALDKMTGVKPEKPAVPPAGDTPTPGGTAQTPTAPAVPAQPTKPEAAPPAVPTPPMHPMLKAATPAATPAAQPGQSPNGAAEAPAPAPPEKPVNKEVVKAKEVAKVKEVAAREAKEKAQSLTERMAGLGKSITLERKLLDTARKKADQYHVLQGDLEKKLQKALSTGADEAAVAELWTKIDEAHKQYNDARKEVSGSSDRLSELQVQLSALQAEQLTALREADRADKESKKAQEKVAELQNPFTLHNILQWLFDHAARLVAIVLGMILLRRVVKLFSHRIVKVVAKSGHRGTREERENRAQTLVGVFRNSTSLLIVSGGLLMLFDEVGIPVVPLMGGAAVLGLAVAFGAQNLIKDYISGFMVLLEDQYGINDVVKIGDTAGLVEKITLRVTVLRDLEGVVHFIPHGSIATVSNKTHGWSRALFEIGVAYKESVDEVMRLLVELGKDLRKDPKFSRLILDDPEMLGVDQFADSAIVIKFFIKTRPLQQWPVRRELLRRIKNKFDELGIEIPFPHRTVYHRSADSGAMIEDGRHGHAA